MTYIPLSQQNKQTGYIPLSQGYKLQGLPQIAEPMAQSTIAVAPQTTTPQATGGIKDFLINLGAKFQEMIGATGETLPERVGGVLKTIASTAKNIALEMPSRAGASMTLEALGQKEFIPQTPVEKFFLGNEPVKSLSERTKEITPTAEKYVGTAGKVATPFLVAGLTLLDLAPFGNSEKTLAKTLLKETDENVVKIILKKAGVAEDLAKEYAPKFADATKIEEVNQGLNSLKNIIKETKVGGVPEVPKDITTSISQAKASGQSGETITLYRAAPKFPSDKFDVGTYFADDAGKAKYYSESHYKGNPADIKVEQFTLPKSAVFKEPSTGNYILKGEAPVQRAIAKDITTSIKSAKQSGQSFDEWVKDNVGEETYKKLYKPLQSKVDDIKVSLESTCVDCVGGADFVDSQMAKAVELPKKGKWANKIREDWAEKGGFRNGKLGNRIDDYDTSLYLTDEYLIFQESGIENFYKLENAPNIKTRSQLKAEWDKGIKEVKVPAGELVPKGISEEGILKERGFAKTVRETAETPKVIKEELKESPLTYKPAPMGKDIEAAQIRVKESPQKAREFLESADSLDMSKSGGEVTATGIELMRHYAKNGDYLSEINVVESLAGKLTKAGQEINAAKVYTQMSPEGALLKAQRIVNQFNKSKWFYQKEIGLTEDVAKNIWEVADAMRKATGDAKIELGWELERLFNSIKPPGMLKQISTIQTIAQLLNPKTIVTRNPLGNEIFYRLERLSRYVATPIDIVKSAITGAERTITFRTVKQGEYWKNWLTGARAGWKGVSPAGLGTQFEVYAPVFKGKWNPLTYLEKTLGATLKSFDFAAYSRAKNQLIGEMGYLKSLNAGYKGAEKIAMAKKFASELDNNLLQIADNYGKYITFQDNNVISVGLQKVKRGLNVGKDFGLGDLINKYPRTPGALLMRGLEYSPVGFLRSAYLIAEPLLKGKAVNSAEVLMALSRAITGTLGATGLGWYLADKGIITGEAPTDKDLAAMERGIGGGQYRINLSALKRWVFSGFLDEATKKQKGDWMYSYDWAQPVALSISLGANANQQMKEAELKKENRGKLAGVPGTIASSLGGAVETIVEQPVLQGIKRFFGGYDIIGSIEATVESMPSSFTPTILNQVRQVEDPISRETYDPSMLNRMVNKMISRIPFLAKELPVKYDTLGNEIKFPQTPNLFNIFFNPGFISQYKPSDAANLVIQIYNESGETKQFPKVAPKSLIFQGKTIQLDGEQISKFQENIGKKTELMFGELARSGFAELPNDEKANTLNYLLGKIYQQERFGILTQEQRKALINSFDEKQKEKFVKDLISNSK